ncbi:amidohydrolase family protein [Niveibacterium umoris]|uniref:Enamidase n=1 Tax=Niveibacterium umoris TaxID=1193620 RepID=A0A840BNX5_9RHOO|nr:amidohydrolase family protein [Niveibacterium umoris]MBB4013238.1 enamidase [Niveibacterium umoris]
MNLRTLAVGLLMIPFMARAETPPNPADKYVLFKGSKIALTHAELIDGSGGEVRKDQTVLIEDGLIKAVLPDGDARIPRDALVKDMSGHSLTPGFVMLHEHWFYPLASGSYGAMFETFPGLYLAGGTTTLRTAGSVSPYADLNTWKDIRAGKIVGPDMDVTAPFLNGKEAFVGQMQRLETPAQATRMVDYWADEGASSYKGYMHLTRAQMKAIITAAHARGQKVTAHLCSLTYTEAADLGIDDLEHGFLVASDFVADKKPDVCPGQDKVDKSLNALAADDPRMLALQQHLRERGVAITSTLTVFETFAAGRPLAPQGALDLLIPPLREAYVAQWSKIARKGKNLWTELLPKAMAWEKRYYDDGGLLVVGTDPTGFGGVVPGYSAVRAIELLLEAGFTLPQAIQVATHNGARYLQREASIGRIAPGLRADLVAFKGSLSADATALNKLTWTMKAGVAYDSPQIIAANKGQVGLH